jgi:hypothetical protein
MKTLQKYDVLSALNMFNINKYILDKITTIFHEHEDAEKGYIIN